MEHDGLTGNPIYLDYNATTPVDPAVAREALPYLAIEFGNPSSGHHYGQAPRHAVAAARESVALLLDCAPEEIVFTGGGSEGDTLAIRGAALGPDSRGGHVITQRTEHPAVLATCRSLARLHDFLVTYLPVDERGLVDPAALAEAITPRTTLVSIMHANNETGTIQPLRELADITHAHGALFHADAAQSVGKVPVSVQELGVDLLTVAGHKFYAPKGIGALYVRSGLRLEPTVYGGGQERGLRGGTENVAFVVALGAAARIAADDLPASEKRLRYLRDLLHQRLAAQLPGRVELNGHPTCRLPNTLNISIDGMSGDRLLADTPGVAASTGSACHADSTDPSPVLAALGLTRPRALAAIRLSVGRWTTEADIDMAASLLTDSVTRTTSRTASRRQTALGS
jgi:cysteine desulfurase